MEKIPTNRHERFSSSALFGLAMQSKCFVWAVCWSPHLSFIGREDELIVIHPFFFSFFFLFSLCLFSVMIESASGEGQKHEEGSLS
jgi:hypothetical protein